MKKLIHTFYIFAAVALAGVSTQAIGAAQGGGKDLTVVELFTSQGCSSCPPADRFLGELAARDGILALSMHVDYWDYIGWKDKFALKINSERQRDYGRRFQQRYVYTPQMVVQGAFQTVGSDRSEALGMIAKAQTLPQVPISLKRTGKSVAVTLPQATVDGEVRVLSVFFDRRHEIDIKRGENSGNKLVYSNVVRRVDTVALWRGEARVLSLVDDGQVGEVCAVLLQSVGSGKILGAQTIDLDRL